MTMPTIPREKPAPRSNGLGLTVKCWMGEKEGEFDVHFSFYPDGRVEQCFCRPFKSGMELEEQLDRFCIVLSIALQSGQRILDIARTTGDNLPRVPRHGRADAPGNIFGEIIRAAVDAETARIAALAGAPWPPTPAVKELEPA